MKAHKFYGVVYYAQVLGDAEDIIEFLKPRGIFAGMVNGTVRKWLWIQDSTDMRKCSTEAMIGDYVVYREALSGVGEVVVVRGLKAFKDLISRNHDKHVAVEIRNKLVS